MNWFLFLGICIGVPVSMVLLGSLWALIEIYFLVVKSGIPPIYLLMKEQELVKKLDQNRDIIPHWNIIHFMLTPYELFMAIPVGFYRLRDFLDVLRTSKKVKQRFKRRYKQGVLTRHVNRTK